MGKMQEICNILHIASEFPCFGGQCHANYTGTTVALRTLFVIDQQ